MLQNYLIEITTEIFFRILRIFVCLQLPVLTMLIIYLQNSETFNAEKLMVK